MTTRSVPIAAITVPPRKRQLRDVSELQKSIADIGLLNPITVTEDLRLVAGLHRLTACRALGWAEIPATVVALGDLKAELAEIDENLVRADLTELEHDQQVVRRKGIYEALHPQTKRGVAQALASNAAQGKGDVAAESAVTSFVEDTARKTGTAPRTIRESVQIATNIVPDVQEAIAETPIADSKTDLLTLARMDEEKQRAVAEKITNGEAKNVRQAERQLKAEQVQEEAKLPTAKYRVVYADPPWAYGNTMPDYYSEQADHYPLMTLKEICALPVVELVEDNAVLFLWVTSPILEESFEVIRAWGFKYKASFVWDKVKHNMGHYNSVRHEFLLIATRGSCQPDVQRLFDSVVSVERTEHSVKPDCFRDTIDILYPHGKRIELFARKQAEGWDVYGNQVPGR